LKGILKIAWKKYLVNSFYMRASIFGRFARPILLADAPRPLTFFVIVIIALLCGARGDYKSARPLPYWFSLLRFLFSKRKREVSLVIIVLLCGAQGDYKRARPLPYWFSLLRFLFSKRKRKIFLYISSASPSVSSCFPLLSMR